MKKGGTIVMEEKDLVETGIPTEGSAEEKAVVTQEPEPEAPKAQPNLLVFGILALALGYQVGIPGIVLGIIGRKRGNRFLASGGVFTKSNRVGYTLSKAGLIVGIVNTVIVTLLIVAYIIFLSVIIAIIVGNGLHNVDFSDILNMFRV